MFHRIPTCHKAALLSASIAFGVDATLQCRRSTYDPMRALRVSSYAAWSTYPQLAYFNVIGSVFNGNTVLTAIAKTATNQMFYAPINVSLAIAWNLALQGRYRDIAKTIKTTMKPAMIEGSIFWIPVNLIGFYGITTDKSLFYFFKVASVGYKYILIRQTA